MKNIGSALILLSLSGLLLSLPAAAQRDGDSGRASKNGKTEGTIDGVEVTLEFGRPTVKGRKLWGALVPHGKVWRTGADEATTISFNNAVKIEGEALAAGKYSLFTIPGEQLRTAGAGRSRRVSLRTTLDSVRAQGTVPRS